MSEIISRRVFLKASGLAVLSAAAMTALAGCSGGGTGGADPTPGNPIYSGDAESLEKASLPNFTVAMDSLSGQFTSQSYYEEDKLSHNYVYGAIVVSTYLNVACTLTTDDFECNFGTVRSLGNFTLNNSASGFDFREELTVPAGSQKIQFVYIDIGQKKFTDLPASMTISVKDGSQRAVFTFNGTSSAPSVRS